MAPGNKLNLFFGFKTEDFPKYKPILIKQNLTITRIKGVNTAKAHHSRP